MIQIVQNGAVTGGVATLVTDKLTNQDSFKIAVLQLMKYNDESNSTNSYNYSLNWYLKLYGFLGTPKVIRIYMPVTGMINQFVTNAKNDY